ncbi:hypothetical protein F5Y11DRAFT_36994 [Daldinia sp. FL1419]|nr:hypothetical protein F5Y11DRAFT_36994 [Daldinia sp. FL1419]
MTFGDVSGGSSGNNGHAKKPPQGDKTKSKDPNKDQTQNQGGSSGQGGGSGAYVSPPDFFSFNDPNGK